MLPRRNQREHAICGGGWDERQDVQWAPRVEAMNEHCMAKGQRSVSGTKIGSIYCVVVQVSYRDSEKRQRAREAYRRGDVHMRHWLRVILRATFARLSP